MSEKPRTGRLGGFELLAQEASDHAYRGVMEMRDRGFGDSPIEHLFFAALVTVAEQGHRCVTSIGIVTDTLGLMGAQRGEWIMGGNINNTAFVEKQVQVAGWRVDFLIRYPAIAGGRDENGFPLLDRLIVECDGHAFHERTKEQAARDRSRDRVAQYEGIPVLRFTGSEIWNDPSGCADEVLAFMERA